MPFDSSGVFTRLRSWKSDAAAGIRIRSDYHDDNDDDIAGGLSNVITKNGSTQPTANIPLNQKKITNLGEPSEPTDAATKNYVDSLKTFTTGMTISGADLNGRINFTATTGVNGLTWTGADFAWLARPAVANQSLPRLVLNDSVAGTGTDVFQINDRGHFLSSNWLQNLAYDGTNWRTIAPGYGSILQRGSDGSLIFYANWTATATDAYAVATMKATYQFSRNGSFAINGELGTSISLNMTKAAGASNAANSIVGYNNSKARWIIQPGNGSPETGSNTGSDYYLLRYDDAGNSLGAAYVITRADGTMTIPGIISGNTDIYSAGVIRSSAGHVVSYDPASGAQPAFGCWSGNRGTAVGIWNPVGATRLAYGGMDANANPTSEWGWLSSQGIQIDAATMYMGLSGSDRIFQYAAGWFWDWNSSTGSLVWYRNNTWGVQMLPDGNFMIFGNTAQKSTAGQWTSYSDARLKDIGSEYVAGLPEVLKITPKWFSWKDKSLPGAHVGIIAQEIEDVLPETITRSKGKIGDTEADDVRVFDPTNIMYALVNAVKELSAKLDDANARIAALEAR